jgi:hypothetical protein
VAKTGSIPVGATNKKRLICNRRFFSFLNAASSVNSQSADAGVRRDRLH